MVSSKQMAQFVEAGNGARAPSSFWSAIPNSCSRSRRVPPSAPSSIASAMPNSKPSIASTSNGCATPRSIWRAATSPRLIASYSRQTVRMMGSTLKSQAVDNLIADWNRDYDPAKSTLILAHLRRDVRMLNDAGARQARRARPCR